MAETPTTFVAFWLYKASAEWRRLPEEQRAELRAAFARTLAEQSGSLTLRGAYSLVGLRHDADLLLWLHGPSMDELQELAVALRRSGLGAYLENVQTYTGLVPQSKYSPEHRPAFSKGAAPRAFLSMYPFVKTHEWYQLPFERRRSLMAAHGRMGQAHSAMPEVRIEEGGATDGRGSATAVATAPAPAAAPEGSVLANTITSFGLGDQEFVVAFESDDPGALVRMVEDLRAAEVRIYTAIDTPIFLGRRKELAEALADLG